MIFVDIVPTYFNLAGFLERLVLIYLSLLTVTCRPEPEVFWYHNNKRIRSSERYDLEHIKGVYRLIIHELDLGDAGQWRCEANNSYGHAVCNCDLKVIGE